MKRVVKLIVVGLVIFSGALTFANSGPTYMSGLPSSGLLAVDKDTPIEVKGENLTFDFSDNEDYYAPLGNVTAEYKMVNPTSEDLLVQMAFPYIGTLGTISSDNIKISSDNEKLSYDIYLGNTIRSSRPDETEIEYFEFEEVIGSISNDIYKAEKFSADEIGKLYSIEINATSDTDINIALEFEYNYENTNIFTEGFNGFFRDGGKTRLTTWIKEQKIVYIYVLGEDIDFSISGYTDGALTEKTDSFTYTISETQEEVKTYFLETIRNSYNDIIPDIQLYNVFAKVVDFEFTNNLGFSSVDNGMSYVDRMIVLVYNVEFPKNSEKTVSVSYKTEGTMDLRNTKEPLYTYDYILNPAKNWKDFKDLNIKIIPPEKAPYVVESTIELNKDDNIYTAFLENLPEDDFKFTFYYKEKVDFWDKLAGRFDRSIGYIMLFTPFILGFILIIVLLYKLIKKKII